VYLLVAAILNVWLAADHPGAHAALILASDQASMRMAEAFGIRKRDMHGDVPALERMFMT
jgi:hypothetical protein